MSKKRKSKKGEQVKPQPSKTPLASVPVGQATSGALLVQRILIGVVAVALVAVASFLLRPDGKRGDQQASLDAADNFYANLEARGNASARRDDEPQSLGPQSLGTQSLGTQPLGPMRTIKVEDMFLYWDSMKRDVDNRSVPTSDVSNIHPDDYVGIQSCKKCHKEQYDNWYDHPHRLMNAYATEENIRGDFSGRTISYKGGLATFYRDRGRVRMKLERDGVVRVFKINRTLGSRFFQYYIGVAIEAPEPKDNPVFLEEHVLHFGYWFETEQWVPIVHVELEMKDEERIDPFGPIRYAASKEIKFNYDTRCSDCHTTFPLGDGILRNTDVLAKHAPVSLRFQYSDYLAEAHPEIWDGSQSPDSVNDAVAVKATGAVSRFLAPEKAVSLGITCESCHLGTKQHVAGVEEKPDFFPKSPYLYLDANREDPARGRSKENVNWTCARCHAGTRPEFANGVHTWNSGEATQAFMGACYSKLTCIDCHDPHTKIGQKWTHTPTQDDQSCIKCHTQYKNEAVRSQHTHHKPGSEGDRCMNCHMPRMMEGLQDMTRTHTIFSPTDSKMLEANQSNACNQCHLEKGIDWTIANLEKWYGEQGYSEAEIDKNYKSRTEPVGIGWLHHENESVRLIAADSLAREKSLWALDDLVEMLDDDYLISRQFSLKFIQKMLSTNLEEDYGYRFWMMKDERRGPLDLMRADLKNPNSKLLSGSQP